MEFEIVKERPASKGGEHGKWVDIRNAIAKTVGTDESVRLKIADLPKPVLRTPQAYFRITGLKILSRRANGSLYVWAEKANVNGTASPASPAAPGETEVAR